MLCSWPFIVLPILKSLANSMLQLVHDSRLLGCTCCILTSFCSLHSSTFMSAMSHSRCASQQLAPYCSNLPRSMKLLRSTPLPTNYTSVNAPYRYQEPAAHAHDCSGRDLDLPPALHKYPICKGRLEEETAQAGWMTSEAGPNQLLRMW